MSKLKSFLLSKARGSRAKVLWVLLLLNALTSITLTFSLFYVLNTALLSELDGRLEAAAQAIPYVLPTGYLDRALIDASMSDAEYKNNIQHLNAYAEKIGVQYLYVLTILNGRVNFLADSASPSEVNDERYGHFRQAYSDESQFTLSALQDGKTRFGHLKDEYGDFRSVSLVIQRADGRRYLLGADIRTEVLLNKQTELRNRVVLIGLVLFLLGSVVAWFLAGSITAPLRHFSAAVHRFAIGEFDVRMPLQRQDELGNLASAFNAMGDAIAAREHLMRRLAFTDRLTGLPNRARFSELLTATINKDPPWFAVVMIDLADFRYVNDSLGFESGDSVLCMVADRLSLLQPDVVQVLSRISANAFVLLLTARNEDEAKSQIKKIEERVAAPLVLGAQKLTLAIRSGVTFYPQHAHTAEPLLRHAEVAMFFAKRERSNVMIYDPSREESRQSQFTLLGDLHEAISENHLVVYYQPKINVVSGKVGAAEALVRWRHPERGWISPGVFIPFAEKIGKLRSITEWVICEVLRQQIEWQPHQLDLLISVNVGVSDVEDATFVDFVEAALLKAGDAARLCLEITETGVMHKPDAMLQNLSRLRQLGVQLSIDDFGTGYSSFAYLAKMPVNELKIDQVFVMSMNSTFESVSIVRSMIEIGHILGLKVVAEGVETIGIWQALAVMGCDEVQGFLIAQPMAAIDFLRWLGEGDHRPIDVTPPSMSNF